MENIKESAKIILVNIGMLMIMLTALFFDINRGMSITLLITSIVVFGILWIIDRKGSGRNG